MSITNNIIFSIFGHCISVFPSTDTTSPGMYAHLRGVCIHCLHIHMCVCATCFLTTVWFKHIVITHYVDESVVV